MGILVTWQESVTFDITSQAVMRDAECIIILIFSSASQA